MILQGDGLGERLGRLYQARPDLFTEGEVESLRTAYPDAFKTDDEVTVGKLVEQFSSGLVAGFTGLGDFADDPQNTWEGLANSTGSVLGFMGILIPGLGETGLISKGLAGATRGAGVIARGIRAESVAQGFFGLSKGIAGVRSVPLFVGEAGFRAFEKSGAGRIAANYLRGKPIAEQALASGLRLGIASGASELHEIYDEGIEAPIRSFAFGLVTGGVMDAGIGNIPFLKERTTAHQMAKAFAGAVVQSSAPLLVMQNPLNQDVPTLAYNAILGGFFGWKAVDATTYRASKFLNEVASKPEHRSFLGRMQAGSIESTREYLELAEADPHTATRVSELAKDIFGERKHMSTWLGRLIRNLYPDYVGEEVLLSDIENVKVGDRVTRDAHPTTDQYEVREVFENGKVKLYSKMLGKYIDESVENLNIIKGQAKEMSAEGASQIEAMDFEAALAKTKNPVKEFLTRVVYDKESGEKFNSTVTEEQVIGHTLNLQARLREIMADAATSPLENKWDTFKSLVKRGLENVLRTVTDSQGRRKIVPFTDEDFGPLKEWFSFETSKVEFAKVMWNPRRQRFVNYVVSEDGQFFKDAEGDSSPRYRVKYAMENLRTGRTTEDGKPEYVKAVEVTDVVDMVKGRDNDDSFAIMNSLLDADLPEKQYAAMFKEMRSKNKLFYAGEGDRHSLVFVDRVEDNLLQRTKAELTSLIEKYPEAQAHFDQLAEINTRRLGIGKAEWEETLLNNLYLWKQLNSDIPLERLLTAKLDNGKPAFITNALDFNKRTQVQVQKFVPLNNDIFKPSSGRLPRIVYVHDMKDVADTFVKPKDMAQADFDKAIAQLRELTSTLNDGGWVVPGPVVNDIADAMGMTKGLGALKAFYMDKDQHGMAIHKFAIHRANDELSKLLMDAGDFILAPLSAAKQVGTRKVYHYRVIDGKLKFAQKKVGEPLGEWTSIPDAYEFNPSGLNLSTGIKDTALEKLNKPVRFIKQLLNDVNNPVAFAALMKHVLSFSKGTERGNAALAAYNTDQTVENLATAVKNFRNMDRVKLLEALSKHPELEKEFNKFALEDDNTESWHEALESGEIDIARIDHAVQRYINSGVEGSGVILSKLARRQYREAYTRFFVQDLIQPRVRHAGSAVIGAWSVDMLANPRYEAAWRSDNEFLLGRDWRNLRIPDINGKESTLEKVWNEFAKLAIGENGKIRSRSEFKGDDLLRYDAYHDALTAVVPRVPLDSASGAPSIRFGGFADVDGGAIFLSSKLAKRMGGADHDIDKAFFYFGLPREVKEFFRNAAGDYDRLFDENASNAMRGNLDKDIGSVQKNLLGAFDPYARLAINKRVALGRGKVLPFAISASEKIGAFRKGIENYTAGIAIGKDALEKRITGSPAFGTRIFYDPSTQRYAYVRTEHDNQKTTIVLRGDRDKYTKTKTAAINKAADAGKDEYGVAHPGEVSAMIYTSAIDQIHLSMMTTGTTRERVEGKLIKIGPHPEKIDLLRPNEEYSKLPDYRRAALQMYFGAPYEVLFTTHDGRLVPVRKANFGFSEKQGKPFLRIVDPELGAEFVNDMSRYSLRVNDLTVPLNEVAARYLAFGAKYKLRYTDFGTYEDAMQKVYRKDRTERRGWAVNDVVASVSRVADNELFKGTPLYVLGKVTKNLYHDDNLITRVVPDGKYKDIDGRFAAYGAFMDRAPEIRGILGEGIALPTKQLYQRAENYAKHLPFTSSEREMRELATHRLDGDENFQYVVQKLAYEQALTLKQFEKPSVTRIEDIFDHYKRMGENLDTLQGRLKFLKRERERINDFLSERIHVMAAVTRMIDATTEFHLSPDKQQHIGDIVRPVVNAGLAAKKLHYEAYELKKKLGIPGSDVKAKDVLDKMEEFQQSITNVYKSAELMAKEHDIEPLAAREFADVIMISGLRYGEGQRHTSESSLGLKWALRSSIEKYAEAYNEAYATIISPEPSAQGVRKLWENKLARARTVGALPGNELISIEKHRIPKDFGTDLGSDEVALMGHMKEIIGNIPSLKDDPALFIELVRKQYNVASLADLTIPQVRGMVKFFGDMRSGNTLMSLLWAKFKKPELYKDVSFKHWLQFVWTIDRSKWAEAMAAIHHKIYTVDGKLDTMGTRPLPYITDEGALKYVYADSATPMSYVGRIGNSYNTANIRIQKSREDNNKRINEALGPLAHEALYNGKDYRLELSRIAWIERELQGLYARKRKLGTDFSDREKELVDSLQQEKKQIYKQHAGLFKNAAFHLRGIEKPQNARDIVRGYMDVYHNLLDTYAEEIIFGTENQWKTLLRRDANGQFDLRATASGWSEFFHAGQAEFNIPYDILRAVDWYTGIVRDARVNKSEPFTFEDVVNFNVPSLKELKPLAQKYGLINGKTMSRVEDFYHKFRSEQMTIDHPEEHEFARELGRYFHVKRDKNSFSNRLMGIESYSQFTNDVQFAQGKIDAIGHARKSLAWRYDAKTTERVDGFMPHLEFDPTLTEEWANRLLDVEKRRAPNDPAGAASRAETISNLYLKLRGEGYLEDGGLNTKTAEAFVRPSMSIYSSDTSPSITSSLHHRTAFAPTYNKDLSVIQLYFDKMATARMRLFAAMESKNTIYNFNEKFAPMVKSGEVKESYRHGWEQFMRLFARDAMGYPSVFPEAMLSDKVLNLKRTPYYWLSDHAFITNGTWARKLYRTLFRTGNLSDIEKRALAIKYGRPLTEKEEEEEKQKKLAIMEDFPKAGEEWTDQQSKNFARGSQALRRFSEFEGRWETAALLFHSKTAIGNIYGGSINNLIWNGFRAFRDSKSIETWQKIAVKSRDGIEFTSMEDVYKWWESTGAVSNQLIMEGSWIQEFSTPQRKAFLEEAIQKFSRNSQASDETLYEMAKKHGLERKFVDTAAWFMKKSERWLRIHAGLAGYLRARENMSPLDLPLNTPWLIDMGIKSTQLTQFMYDAPNRPAFSRTNMGRVYGRFKVWAWASQKFQRDVFNEARYAGYSPYSAEGDRLQRLMTANLFALSLASLVPYSIFDYALPAPMSYWQDAAKFFFGDDKERENMYFGTRSIFLKYPFNPLNELMPPIARLGQGGAELFQLAFSQDEVDWLAQYTLWSTVPFGRMSRDVIRAMRDPEMAFDFITGIPTHKIGYQLKRKN